MNYIFNLLLTAESIFCPKPQQESEQIIYKILLYSQRRSEFNEKDDLRDHLLL